MTQVLLLHNPGAGEEEHDEHELTERIVHAGYKCRYQSVKVKGWEKKLEKADLVVVAGGDGTVRKAVRALLRKKKRPKRFPQIAVLPLGTANNISKTINTGTDAESIIAAWSEKKLKPFDIGWVKGLSQDHFFIEGVGFGVFPALVHIMETVKGAISDDPEKQIQIALELLSGIIGGYKAQPTTLEIDGVDHSGEFLLLEIMNICSVGPNLGLTQNCDPGDHLFDVVMIPASGRQQLLDYIGRRLRGQEIQAAFPAVKGSSIRMKTGERNMHIDDKLIKRTNDIMMHIELDKHRLTFRV